MPGIDRQAQLIALKMLARASELEHMEQGPEAEALRAQAGAMYYAMPELMLREPEKPKPVRRTLWRRIMGMFR